MRNTRQQSGFIARARVLFFFFLFSFRRKKECILSFQFENPPVVVVHVSVLTDSYARICITDASPSSDTTRYSKRVALF